MRIILLVALGLPLLIGQVRVGQRAPALTVGDVLQGRLGPSSSGNSRMIELWATWCGPCIDSLPHLNELVDQFKGRKIDFIALTGEDRAKVEPFLKDHPMHGIVALDPGFFMTNQYGGNGLPTTILIDAAGRVMRVLHPKQVTAEVLEDLISDRPVNIGAIGHEVSKVYLPLKHPEGYYFSSTGQSKAVVRVEVGISDQPPFKYNSVRPGGSVTDITPSNQLEASRATLPDLLSFAYGLSPFQMDVPKYFRGGGYDAEGWVPSEHAELLKPLLRMALEAAIDYHPRMEKRVLDVLVLKGLPGRLRIADKLVGCKSMYDCEGQELEYFRNQVEGHVGKLVVIDNAPKIRVSFKFDVGLEAGGYERVLRDQLGLKLVPERRSVDFLVIEPIESKR